MDEVESGACQQDRSAGIDGSVNGFEEPFGVNCPRSRRIALAREFLVFKARLPGDGVEHVRQ
jgi:hypothetical protein